MSRQSYSSRLHGAATIALVGCALVITALIIRREFFPPVRPLPLTAVPDWRAYAVEGHRMGPREPAVTITTFSDFQCPACRVLAGYLREVRRQHPDEVAVIYRHFPLPTHAAAAGAARASECAARQGRFEAFHDALFADQDSIGLLPWGSFAEKAGRLEPTAFERCLSDDGMVVAIDRDLRAGRRLGVTATPTMLVNRVSVRGTPSREEFQGIVERELALARQ